VSKTVNINGLEFQVEEGVIVKIDSNGSIRTEMKNDFAVEDKFQLVLPVFKDAVEEVVEEEEEEEIELIQCNFLAERWLIDFFSKEYKKAKQQSTSKLLKREFVGQLIAGKFQDEHPSE
jgi:hypothetical protein